MADQVALVTGGGRGIGAAITQTLLDADWRVAVVDLEAPADNAFSGNWKFFSCDVSKFDEAQRTVEAVVRHFNDLHALVNNAGINRDGVIWKMTEEDWDQVCDVDLKGCFNFCRAVAPILRDKQHGRIVNITSINGLRGKFGQTNYAAAKAGVVGLTKSLARELGRRHITVNAVAPGLIETAMTADLPEEVRQASCDESALGRLGQAEDVAHAVEFLLSDRARHITGDVLKVDGGQYI